MSLSREAWVFDSLLSCFSHQVTMDVFDVRKRSKVMAAIKSKNTRPEIIVRKYLFSRGFRYRLYHHRLPGHPDLVMRKYRTCIFVNGCFWHGHEGCKYFRMPKTNTDFWESKIEKNKNRDKADQLKLAKLGWHCVTIWECQLRPPVRQQTLLSLEYTLNSIFLADHAAKYEYPVKEMPGDMAAEDLHHDR